MTLFIPGRPPVEAPVAGDSDPRRSRPQVVVLLERVHPASSALRQVVWFANRLQAELAVAAIVTRAPALDELERVRLRMAAAGVRAVVARLVEQGARASGEVYSARYGDEGRAAADVADRLDADLVIVVSRRGSWLGLFPGSPLAHRLMRSRRRPVLVIPDRVPRQSWGQVLRGLIGDGEREL